MPGAVTVNSGNPRHGVVVVDRGRVSMQSGGPRRGVVGVDAG